MGQVSDDVVPRELVKVNVNPEVEAYPVLAIYPNDASELEVPADLLARLTEARAAVDVAELAIMRYVAEQYDRADVREWLTDNEPLT